MCLPPDVCIYIMYTYHMQDMYTTCCFPSPSATQPSPIPPLPISTRPTSSRWGPPYVPWCCLKFLLDYQGVSPCPLPLCLLLRPKYTATTPLLPGHAVVSTDSFFIFEKQFFK